MCQTTARPLVALRQTMSFVHQGSPGGVLDQGLGLGQDGQGQAQQGQPEGRPRGPG